MNTGGGGSPKSTPQHQDPNDDVKKTDKQDESQPPEDNLLLDLEAGDQPPSSNLMQTSNEQ